MTSPFKILEQYWGYEAFKASQEEIIESVLDGNDTVALLPTGGGKSLCFQVPALAKDGICIVVSPLVALMTDQVEALKSKGIKAMAIAGGIKFTELSTLLDNAIFGNFKFLYLSPERLQQELVQNGIKRMNVNLIAVDEAHCISQWGNDFRPAYKNIKILKELHPFAPVIALTATATPEVLKDTIKELQLESPRLFKNSFVRFNLSYLVQQRDDKLYHIEQLLKRNTGSAIVYVRSRKAAEEISSQLNHLGISSTYYHGGLNPTEKKNRLSSWKQEQISTMVATNAFGMGIDHGNVRFVIHSQLPESLESYFQEAGRAGRDGLAATAIILYNASDQRMVQKQFVDAMPETNDVKKLYRTLNNYFQISYGEGEFSNHSFSFTDFCKTYELNTLVTYNALNTMDRLGVLQLSKEFGRKSVLRFLVSSEVLLREFENNVSFSMVGKTILRMYGGIFDTPNTIDLKNVAHKMGTNVPKVIAVLKEMERLNLCELRLHETDASITFLVPREDEKTINPLSKEIEAIRTKKKKQVAAVLSYIENTEICRSVQLSSYFGEENPPKCGTCEACLKTKISEEKIDLKLISEKIKNILIQGPQNSRSISEKSTFAEDDILKVLKLLLDAKKVKLDEMNRFYLNEK